MVTATVAGAAPGSDGAEVGEVGVDDAEAVAGVAGSVGVEAHHARLHVVGLGDSARMSSTRRCRWPAWSVVIP